MNNKKLFTIAILSLLVLSFSLNFVLAQENIDSEIVKERIAAGTSGFIVGLKEGLQKSLAPLFGQKELLSRIFLAVLLFLLVYTAVNQIFKAEKKVLSFLIAIVVTALALIALPPDFVRAVRTQYGAMGATILSIIPFLIIFWFSAKVQSLLVARIIWIFYVIYYFALFIYEVAARGWNLNSIPYVGAIIAGILIFFFIGGIRNAIFKGEMSAVEETGKKIAERAKLLHKLQKTELKSSYGESP